MGDPEVRREDRRAKMEGDLVIGEAAAEIEAAMEGVSASNLVRLDRRERDDALSSTSGPGGGASSSTPSIIVGDNADLLIQDCNHKRVQLYVEPCLKCEMFCNCLYSYFPPKVPDVLVRSLDKKIVRLSKDLVRSSEKLSLLVSIALKERKEGKGQHEKENQDGNQGQQPPQPQPISRLERVKKIMEEVKGIMGSGPSLSISPDDEDDNDEEDSRHQAKEAVDPFQDLVDIGGQDEPLVLYDTKTETPTLAVFKDTLEKVDYFICMHLEEIDRRVASRRRAEEFIGDHESVFNRHVDERKRNEDDRMFLRGYATEEWEQTFFNVDSGQFLELFHANQELLIWDLYFALQKWIGLFRGYPDTLVGGSYNYIYASDYRKAKAADAVGGGGEAVAAAAAEEAVYGGNPRGRSSRFLRMRGAGRTPPCRRLPSGGDDSDDEDTFAFRPSWWTLAYFDYDL